MDLNKASEVYDFYLAEIEKAKYIKRTGSPGNYKYVYPGGEKKGQSGKKVVENSGSKVTNKQESEGEKKMNEKDNYNWDLYDFPQESEIKFGIKHGLSKEQIEVYSNPQFDSQQMHSLRTSLEMNIPIETVKVFANVKYSSSKMDKMRDDYKKQINIQKYKKDMNR